MNDAIKNIEDECDYLKEKIKQLENEITNKTLK
jgi:prefoldin subunit 5